MLVDANILLFAVDASSPFHRSASGWLTAQLNGSTRVAFPWQSVEAFVRISTHARATTNPLSADAAWRHVTDWLAADVAWTPVAHGRPCRRARSTHPRLPGHGQPDPGRDAGRPGDRARSACHFGRQRLRAVPRGPLGEPDPRRSMTSRLRRPGRGKAHVRASAAGLSSAGGAASADRPVRPTRPRATCRALPRAAQLLPP